MLTNSLFLEKGEKILLIVPHQDDEINMVGSLYEYFLKCHELKVLFVTNGDKNCDKNIRLREANKVAKMLSKNECISILGYPDSYVYNNKHLYNLNSCFNKYTESAYIYNDYHFENYGKHSNVSYDSLLFDLKSFIYSFMPDTIYFTGFDSHPDHKMVFLTMIDIVNSIVKNSDKEYYPECYYAYAYETSYNAPDDYFYLNFESTKMTRTISKNTYYFWEARERFPVYNGYLRYNYRKSRLYVLLKQYKSQNMKKRFFRIQNTDHVFWRLPSLYYQSLITQIENDENKNTIDYGWIKCEDVLSSNALLDTNYISNDSLVYYFSKEIEVYRIIIMGQKLDNIDNKINIFCNKNGLQNKCYYEVDLSINNLCILKLGNIKSNEFKISLLDEEIGISRVFFDKPPNFKICKICEKDNFVYEYYTKKKVSHSFNIYSNFDSAESNYVIQLNGRVIDTLTGLSFKKNGTYILKITHRECFSCFDEIIIKVTPLYSIKSFIFIQRIIHKMVLKMNEMKKFLIRVIIIIRNKLINKNDE